jgi:CheY-like chemotaxis protein
LVRPALIRRSSGAADGADFCYTSCRPSPKRETFEETCGAREQQSRGGGLGVTKSILVVEDEPNIVLSLQFLMKKAGFEVRVARDGEEALAAVGERAPDLILLDVMIPKRDGYDVCQTIRANPDLKSVYIIMLTAKGREVDREKGIALGANDYVTKPFSTRDLTEKVKQILDGIG